MEKQVWQKESILNETIILTNATWYNIVEIKLIAIKEVIFRDTILKCCPSSY